MAKSTKSRKIFNGNAFLYNGHRATKKAAQALAKLTRKTNLARVLPNRDARGKKIWIVWASVKKKRPKSMRRRK